MKSMQWLGLVTLAVLLVACGGSDAEPETKDPLAAYKNQKLSWGSCDAYFSKYSSEGAERYISKLGSRLQCADIEAPLDYKHPDGLKIKVSVLRVQAADAPEKKPHLFFNPGGPGGDGLNLSLAYSQMLAGGNPNTALGAIYKKVSESFNFVGFSPRGVGASTNLQCSGNEQVYAQDSSADGENAENIRRITDSARYMAVNCQKNPISDFINTDATARDMDLMRHLFGDEKMHYYGISYGTWLGFWYAGLFPERVGPMVVDSNMNFSQSIHAASISYEVGKIHSFANHIAPYAARHNSSLGMGTSTQEIVDRLKRLAPPLNQMLVQSSFRAEPDTIANELLYARMLMDASGYLRNGMQPSDIANRLQNIQVSTGDPDVDASIPDKASSIGSGISMLNDPQYWTAAVPFSADNSDSVFNTVVCNDELLLERDPVYWVNKGFELARTLPIANNRIAGQPCLYWKRQLQFSKPSMASLKTARMLMVQSEYDVPTPLAGAMETFEQLPATSMVYVMNEGSHGLMVYQTECVDLTVMNYLLGQAPAQRLTQCQGKPLPLDAQVQTLQARSIRSLSTSGQEPSNFEDPELARTLLERLRKAISSASLH